MFHPARVDFQAAAAGFLGGQAVEVGLVDVAGLIDAVETGRIEGFDLRIECFDDGFQIAQILENDAVRQGIKEYSDWPTIPQLYVNGEFVGGSDILMEMYEAGELQELLKA